MIKSIKSKTLLFFASCQALIVPLLAYGQTGGTTGGTTGGNLPSKTGTDNPNLQYDFASGDLQTSISTILQYFLGAVIIAAVFFIIKAGWTFATAGGDQDKVASARKEIMYAAIGVVIALVAIGVVNLVIGALQ